MARRSRENNPGALHHVYNRGIARRTVFESREDVRYFLSRLARVHRKGRMETHAFNFLTNHYHLIVRSPAGELSRSMQETVNPFVRWFNRRRKRDGSLFRGRFGSRRVQSTAYLLRLVPYVDQNSAKARIVSHAEIYPHGSARLFMQEESPKWHTRKLIEELTCSLTGQDHFHPSLYRECFGAQLTPAEEEWLALRLSCPRDGPDPLDDLVGASPDRVRAWMVRKAELADGSRPGLPLLAPSVAVTVLRECQAEDPDLRFGPRGKARTAWPLLLSGILRDECGLSVAATAAMTGRPASSVSFEARTHRELLLADSVYAVLAANVLGRMLDRMHGEAVARLRGARPAALG
jgi:REP element-mobilizing transposase RayT